MRALLQRVTRASVAEAGGGPIAAIGPGLLVLVCTMAGDGEAEAEFLARKISAMRLFEDEAGKMNRSLLDVGGQALVVSQFTLAADWRKGNRPSFSDGADLETAERLYGRFVEALRAEGVAAETGRFRTHMHVELVNDGPVTIWMDTDQR